MKHRQVHHRHELSFLPSSFLLWGAWTWIAPVEAKKDPHIRNSTIELVSGKNSHEGVLIGNTFLKWNIYPEGSLIEGRYPAVGHFEGKIFSSWACEPGGYSYKPVFEMNNMPNCYLSFFQNAQLLILSGGFPHLFLPPRYCVLCPADFILRERSCSFLR